MSATSGASNMDAGLLAPIQGIPLGHPGINEDSPMYHWSPSENREAILENGLRIRSMSTEGIWRPPFIAFSSTPSLAWSLSAMRTDYDNGHQAWDLWMIWAGATRGFETIPFDDGEPREYRVYHSIRKDRVWYVGSRNIGD